MSRPSKPKPASPSSRGRAPVRKASARKRKGQTVRFDFDSHGAQAAFVDVLDEDTSEASDLIAAAIRQSWDDADPPSPIEVARSGRAACERAPASAQPQPPAVRGSPRLRLYAGSVSGSHRGP